MQPERAAEVSIRRLVDADAEGPAAGLGSVPLACAGRDGDAADAFEPAGPSA